ncbi:MAG TPA: hypothetical protein VFA49_14760 [Chloroflexota bacterium]|nr:hypothetical protein [Chloroflexota bacterium]
MNDQTTKAPAVEEKAAARDVANWAKAVSQLDVSDVPEGAVNINVQGRRLTSPIQGFGKMWLLALAGHFDHEAEVHTQVVCVDKRRQWSKWRNVWHSSAIRSALYTMGAPGRAVKRLLTRDRAIA